MKEKKNTKQKEKREKKKQE